MVEGFLFFSPCMVSKTSRPVEGLELKVRASGFCAWGRQSSEVDPKPQEAGRACPSVSNASNAQTSDSTTR